MKIKSIFHALVLFMAVLMLGIPVASVAQYHNSMQQQAIADAKRDAEASVRLDLWATAGCLGGFFGVLTAVTYHRPVPTVPLLGKSAEYTAFYTDTYRAETQRLQVTPASIGCAVGTVISMLTIAAYGRNNNLW